MAENLTTDKKLESFKNGVKIGFDIFEKYFPIWMLGIMFTYDSFQDCKEFLEKENVLDFNITALLFFVGLICVIPLFAIISILLLPITIIINMIYNKIKRKQ